MRESWQQNSRKTRGRDCTTRSARLSPRWDITGPVALLDRLHRYEATLSRINDNDANGHPRPVVEVRDGKRYEYSVEDVAWAARDEKKEAGIQGKVRALLEPLGIGSSSMETRAGERSVCSCRITPLMDGTGKPGGSTGEDHDNNKRIEE